jgi:hypothetical protein
MISIFCHISEYLLDNAAENDQYSTHCRVDVKIVWREMNDDVNSSLKNKKNNVWDSSSYGIYSL